MPEIEEKFLLMNPPSTPSSIPVFTPSYLITHFQFPSPSAPFPFTILISPQAIWALMLPARWTPNPVCSPSSLQYDHTSPIPQTSATLPPDFCNPSPRLLVWVWSMIMAPGLPRLAKNTPNLRHSVYFAYGSWNNIKSVLEHMKV